jgi:acyl carrier protein
MSDNNLQPSSFEILLKMSRAEIEEKVIKITEENLNRAPGEVTLEANFISDLAADSLDTVELILAIEDAFDIEVTDEESSKIATVKDIVDYIERIKNDSNHLNIAS